MKFVYSALLFLFIACSCIREIEAKFSVEVKNTTDKLVYIAAYKRFHTRSSFESMTEPIKVPAGAQLSLELPTVNHLRSVYINAAFEAESLPKVNAETGIVGTRVLGSGKDDRRSFYPSVTIEKNKLGKLVLTPS